MAGSPPPPRIPLPRGWPSRVRSAVIHAISLAGTVNLARLERGQPIVG